MTAKTLKITAITPAQAAKILAAASKHQMDEQRIRQVAEDAQIIRMDGTFSLIDYVAYLAGEVTGDQNTRND